MENYPIKTTDFITPELNLWVAVKRHWIVAALTTATVFGGLAFKTLREPGVYRSEALIVIGNRVAVPLVQDTTTKEFAENLPTEIEILQSPTLLNRAIAKLSPAERTVPVWEIQSNLSLTQPKDTNVLSLAYEDTNATRAKAILDATVAAYLEYSEESRRSPVTNAIKFIEKRLDNLKSDLEKSSKALTNFRTQNNLDNPDNSVTIAYTSKQELQQAINVAEIELNQLQKTNQALKRQMVELGQNPETALEDAVLSQDQTYQALSQQLTALEVQYKLEEARYTPNNPIMQELRERRDELKKIVEAESQNLQQSPRNFHQKLELGAIQQNLATKLLENRLSILSQEKRLTDLRQQAVTANLKLKELFQLQQQYQQLTRQYELNAQTLDSFLSKLQELRIQEAQDTFTWKVIEPPNLPTVPIARSRIRGLVLGFITGALAGVGVAFFLEKIDSRLKEVKDVKGATDLPILGIIPQAQTATAVGLQTSDSFTEAIRSLALSLSFQNTQVTGKIVAITSAIAGEGKTTITYNLGLALAELNQRVLIVDANLADPQIHKVFALANSQGLTTAIASNRPWQELIQSPYSQSSENLSEEEDNTGILRETMPPASKNGNLPSSVFARVSTAALLLENSLIPERPIERFPDFLTAGPVSTASFPWVVSLKMQQLLEQWRKVYDYILLDTSDITGLADAQSLTSKVDEVIFVVSLNRVERNQVTEALDLLKRNQSKIAGVVVNTTGRGKGEAEAYTPFS
jgi:uncharacterized protein involved in exopolysaccharide biosynthesis/Mrp family chromosome partitioning ATPase